MDFALSDEQRQLRDVARGFFAEHQGASAARDFLVGSLDGMPDMSPPLASMGFLGMLGHEDFGGTGGTVVDLVVIAEECGRQLAPAALSSVAAQTVPLLTFSARGGSAAAADLLELVIAGKCAVAVPSPGGLRRDGDVVSGVTSPTPHGAVADMVLVAIDGALLAVPVSSDGARRQFTKELDPTREFASLAFDGVTATVLDGADHVERAWRRARSMGMLTLAAECSGVVAACLDFGVEYAKTRQAFGRPIGSFQAVKHLLVDIYVRSEQLRSLTWLAAARADAGEDFGTHAAGALSYAIEASRQATDGLIQVHGGIGVTWEHDAHLYWRRARSDGHIFGEPAELRHGVAQYLIDGARRRHGVDA